MKILPLASLRALGFGFLLAAATATLPAQTLVLQLQADNYDPVTGTWAATFGSNALQATAASRPTLVTGVTPNGSSAVSFDGTNDFFNLETVIPAGSAYTAFAYLRVNDTNVGNNAKTIFGGGTGTFQYRLLGDEKQDVLRQSQTDLGASTTAVSTSAFSSINVTVSTSGGGTYRLNGANDGATAAPADFTNTIQYIGSNSGTPGGGVEIFSGDIVELRIYQGAMTDAQRLAVEQEFSTSYGAVPEPSSLILLSVAGAGFVILVRRRRTAFLVNG